VAYRPDGSAISVIDVSAIRARGSGESMRQFAGIAPDLTAGQPVDDLFEDAID
jgi:hypothetical protein